LYRVNGIYDRLGISFVVVVGGNGEWLDVADNVIMLSNYLVTDATKKARSISQVFSYGHVQYAGRGVLHRLSWDASGIHCQRRPTHSSIIQFNNAQFSINSGFLLSFFLEQGHDANYFDHIGDIDIT